MACIACTVYVRKTVRRDVCLHLRLQMGMLYVSVLVCVCHKQEFRQIDVKMHLN